MNQTMKDLLASKRVWVVFCTLAIAGGMLVTKQTTPDKFMSMLTTLSGILTVMFGLQTAATNLNLPPPGTVNVPVPQAPAARVLVVEKGNPDA